MHLELRGHPLHSRGMSVDLIGSADGKIDVHAELVDLRKRAFVPVGGGLQPAGIVHHMQLNGSVDPAPLTLESLAAAQPAVAFEPSEIAAGESCRDPIDRVRALAGRVLDAGFSREVSAEIGGPRGCSHVVTLAHLLGSTAPRALAQERERFGSPPPRAAGERVFRRNLAIDGTEIAAAELQLALQLTDLHVAPTTGIVRPMERFAGQLELRALISVDLRKMEITAIAAAERERDAVNLRSAEWRDRSADVAPLVGLRLAAGVVGALRSAFGERAEDRPLLDVLLNATPALHQCMAVLNEGWILSDRVVSTHIGMGGPPGSCYMWRVGGALDSFRESESESEPAGN